PEVAARLASLGYIGSVRERADPRSLPNPNEAVVVLGEMQSAFALVSEKRYAEAIPALEAVLGRYPKMQEVRVRLAEAQAGLGRIDAAIASYRAALASSDVMMPDVLLALGDVYLRAQKGGEAAEIANLVRSRQPAEAAALDARIALLRGDAAASLARADEAERLAGRPLFGLGVIRGEAYARMEKPREAIDAYRREIATFPSNAEAYARLAVVLFLSGDRAGVVATLDALAKVDPAMAARTRAALGV
ncbi:MAG TPA: tetratricopeptide repeat protein, partial [Thermoanaerobaculia bacterium]|nr:tetratricopeptide repeat protein [Thermoanaerobaculia bacterium]